MLETIIKLLERFVVAHELIAANSAKQTAIEKVGDVLRATETPAKELPVEGEDVIDTKPAKAKPEPEDDLADDEEPEEKPKRKQRQAKPKDEPKGPDVAKLREEIKTIAKAIAAGDSDECADKFDELLEDYKVRTVTKLADEDVEAFHKDATKLVGKYYEVEED
ncbi:hypothetical protein U9V99_004247 [Salmonella enterica subsp. enterica serovar Montevideo]|nr:hypothetical protein [Salmonella enterica subsp. enterica serovar Montevideo]KAA6709266.1 hypothetical protein E5A26_21855 [Salmonella enterica subsp. enterica serovar Cerro]KAA6656016.1 hypothetical protein E5A40_22880 [Salmonella enterica subsp. enterica serovar Montevideo]KAA6658863.1 hypothetical protein E5A41_05400 [Salmonella enterica subsp. enterica serovar Montevideo]KAA6669290.1 hypothetical protein E5A35_22375 [Salmonella enterica subsp. enterica serovar Montevideo]